MSNGSGQVGGDVGELLATSNRMGDSHGEFETALASVRSVVEQMASAWVSRSGGTFQNIMDRWDQNGRVLVGILDELGYSIRLTGTELDTTVDDQAAQLGRIEPGNLLNGLG